MIYSAESLLNRKKKTNGRVHASLLEIAKEKLFRKTTLTVTIRGFQGSVNGAIR